jgi:hypothetical protein
VWEAICKEHGSSVILQQDLFQSTQSRGQANAKIGKRWETHKQTQAEAVQEYAGHYRF